MATLAESLISSTSRPLTLRMRPDLNARRHRYHGRTFWVVKEPVGLNYFRFHDEEFAILCMLDGRSSLDDIKEEFETQFTPQKITFHDLLQFVGMLHRSGLVISEQPLTSHVGGGIDSVDDALGWDAWARSEAHGIAVAVER